MKIQFLTASDTSLAEENPSLLDKIKAELQACVECEEVNAPAQADAIVLHEATSFKEWRYIEKLRRDPVIGQFPEKTYTINTDDSSAGLLRGLYTSLAAPRFDSRIHRAVPFPTCLNERVLERRDESWGDRISGSRQPTAGSITARKRRTRMWTFSFSRNSRSALPVGLRSAFEFTKAWPSALHR